MDGDTYIQMRNLQGGGSRQIKIEKSATINTVYQRVVNLFFLMGKSTKGHISDFETKWWIFRYKS